MEISQWSVKKKTPYQHDEAHSVETTEVRLFPPQALLKIEQEGSHFLSISAHPVFCPLYVMRNWVLNKSKSAQ